MTSKWFQAPSVRQSAKTPKSKLDLLKIFHNPLSKYLIYKVFFTHVGIHQMLTRLQIWKAKSLYHVGTFLLTWIFLPFQKFKTITTKPQKFPIPKQYLLTTYFKDFQRYFQIYLPYSLSLANCRLLRKSIVVIDRCCLFFFQ